MRPASENGHPGTGPGEKGTPMRRHLDLDLDLDLERAWEATRPAPSPAAFDALWAEVSHRADSTPAPACRSRRPFWAYAGAAMMAQAAALLVAALVLDRPAPVPHQEVAPPLAATKRVEIDEGQIAIISVDGRGDLFVEAPAGAGVSPDLDLLNAFEAMASL